jgi:hypothetical protein
MSEAEGRGQRIVQGGEDRGGAVHREKRKLGLTTRKVAIGSGFRYMAWLLGNHPLGWHLDGGDGRRSPTGLSVESMQPDHSTISLSLVHQKRCKVMARSLGLSSKRAEAVRLILSFNARFLPKEANCDKV